MFGKHKKIEVRNSGDSSIVTIPDVFYGGNDPAIYQTSGRGNSAPSVRAGGFFSWKKILFIFVPVFVASVGIISWYYVRQSGALQKPPESAVPLIVVRETPPVSPIAPEPTTTIAEAMEPSISPPAIPLAPKPELTLRFPQTFLADSPDADADSLTDAEEELFGTDSGVWDTDGDGYYDGQELLNLYNPKGTSPVKLVDSGFAREYVNPKNGYRLYYPSGWNVGNVENDDQVLISGISGDFIEIRVLPKADDTSFSDWFAATASAEKFDDLIPLSNRFNVPGWRRRDDLAAYFPLANAIAVIIYHPAGAAENIQFRHVSALMAASFRPGSGAAAIPEQTALPQAPQ